MHTKDGINYYADEQTRGQFVSKDVIIDRGLMVRDLYESPSYSQSGGWDKTYRQEGWLGTAWHPAECELRGWVGQRYSDYIDNVSGGVPLHELFMLEE